MWTRVDRVFAGSEHEINVGVLGRGEGAHVAQPPTTTGTHD